MLDVSHELIIIPWKRGIKLINPKFHQNQNPLISLGEFLKLPFNIYFLDEESAHRALNESEANIMGFDSIQATIGKSVFDISDINAPLIRQNDLSILKNGVARIIEEEVSRTDGEYFQTLSFKYPIYNDINKIIGLFGCSIVLGDHSLSNSLAQINQLGLFVPMQSILNQKSDLPVLTKRQMDCLIHLIKGKTIKQIAQILQLSPRTIEHYLNAIRAKLDCDSRSQLIYKAIQIQAIKDKL